MAAAKLSSTTMRGTLYQSWGEQQLLPAWRGSWTLASFGAHVVYLVQKQKRLIQSVTHTGKFTANKRPRIMS